MAQSFDLYVDTYSGKSVTSELDSTPANLPRFIQGDTFNMRVYLLARTKNWPLGDNSDPANKKPPYLIINNSTLTLKAALGVKDGLPASTLYTQQFSWSKDANNQYFYSTFPMNTAAIATLIGANPSANAWFELEITDAGLPWTVLQENITVQAEVIDTNTALTVPAGQTAMGAEEARATFLSRKISGPIYLEDINNPGQYIALYNENGSLKVDNVGGTLP